MIETCLSLMVLLIAASGFFSGSEAAFFSLSNREQSKLRPSNPSDAAIERLSKDPDQLLTAILFWNLGINIGFFSIASVLGNHLAKTFATTYATGATAFASLLGIIVFGELLPKNFAVLRPLKFARMTAPLLSIAVRIAHPLSRFLRGIAELSRRLIWPGLKPEKNLSTGDLQRAIELTTEDDSLLNEESEALNNIIELSKLTAEEWMRPISGFRKFATNDSAAELMDLAFEHRYCLLLNPITQTITHSVRLAEADFSIESTSVRSAKAVSFVAWCSPLTDVLSELIDKQRDMALVLNEVGDAVGLLTLDDLAESIFDLEHSQATTELTTPNVEQISEHCWSVTGITTIRRVERALGTNLDDDDGSSLTIAGLIQEQLGRVAQKGDRCQLRNMEAVVVHAPRRGAMLIELRRSSPQNNSNPETGAK